MTQHERKMKLNATINTEEPHERMHRLFAAELGRTHERSAIALENRGGKAVFQVTANDTTALRAALNTITSALGMYEKTTEARNGNQF